MRYQNTLSIRIPVQAESENRSSGTRHRDNLFNTKRHRRKTQTRTISKAWIKNIKFFSTLFYLLLTVRWLISAPSFSRVVFYLPVMIRRLASVREMNPFLTTPGAFDTSFTIVCNPYLCQQRVRWLRSNTIQVTFFLHLIWIFVRLQIRRDYAKD